MTTTAGVALGPRSHEERDAADQPAGGPRPELLPGSRLVDRAPSSRHRCAGDELRALPVEALRAAGPTDLVITGVGAFLSTERRDGPIPDVVVGDRASSPVVTAAQLHLVVEVWSRGNARRERGGVRDAHAAAGVASSWEVEQDDAGPSLLTAHELVDASHRVATTVRRGDGSVVIDAAPAPTTPDVARLLL